MNPKMRKRLDAIEDKLSPDEYQNDVWFTPLENETDAEYARRIERWRAGEKVEGQDRPYTGKDQRVDCWRFVKPEPYED